MEEQPSQDKMKSPWGGMFASKEDIIEARKYIGNPKGTYNSSTRKRLYVLGTLSSNTFRKQIVSTIIIFKDDVKTKRKRSSSVYTDKKNKASQVQTSVSKCVIVSNDATEKRKEKKRKANCLNSKPLIN